MMIKLKEVLNELKNEVVRPVYFLKGPDPFLQNFFIKYLTKIYFQNTIINKTLLLPDDMKGSEIIDRISTRDLFSSKKLFILRNVQQIKGKPTQDLLAFCEKPIQNHILVIISDDWLLSSATLKKIEKIISPIDVQTPFENDIKKWAKYLFKENKKTITDETLNSLVNLTGDNLSHLNNEIEKICISVGERASITSKDIEQFSGWKRQHQRWELFISLGNKNQKKSLLIGKVIIKNQESMISLIYPLTCMFQEILFEKMKNGTFSNNRSYLPIPPSVRKKIPQFSKNYSFEDLESILAHLGAIDCRQKTAFSIDEAELIQFISNVTE